MANHRATGCIKPGTLKGGGGDDENDDGDDQDSSW